MKISGFGRCNKYLGVVALLGVLLVCAETPAMAGQRGAEQGGKKPKYSIEGKHENMRSVENMMEESEESDEPAMVSVYDKEVTRLEGRFKIENGIPVEEAVVNFIDKHRNAFGLKNPKAVVSISFCKFRLPDGFV